MSTPHSLSFSPSPSTPPPTHVKRLSQGSQLPLPPSLNASASQRPQGGVTVSSIAGPSSPTLHTRVQSATSGRAQGDYQQPNSPTLASFAPPIVAHHTSSTHAGGIQPSASFFRPARPAQQPQYSRPSSAGSSTGGPSHAPDTDVFQLGPLSKHTSNESTDDPLGSVGGGPDSTADDHNQSMSVKPRVKPSREPLLPIGGRPSGLSARMSLTRQRSATVTTPQSPSRGNTSRLVRNSLDRVFNLSRGMSFESIRRSGGSRSEGRTTFEGKITDEERGYHEPPSSHYDSKDPSSPMRFGQSLNVTASRHSPMHPTPSPSPSPDPSFIPHPPDSNVPLAAVPIVDSKTGVPVRNYQRHPSRNKFFLGGHLLTGGDSPWAFIASFTLLLTIAGVWFGTTSIWWWNNESPAVAAVGIYMTLLVISSMLATATCDPGILPRNLDPDPPYPATSPSDGGVRAPMPRDLKVRSDVVRVKYCPTCKTYRPPRSSHCKMCDNCVDGCDHHCQWVNNCVGRRNYTSFFVLLLSATTTLIMIIVTSALHLYFLTRREGVNFRGALSKAPGSAIAFSLSIAVIWPVAALLSYHMRLLLLNITTIEQIRNQAHKSLVPGPAPPNPFSHGNWRRNLMAVLCRPVGSSWLDAAAVATEDKREVNPGMVDGLPWDSNARRGIS